MHNSYSTPAFEEKYTYTGADLGAVWSEHKTAFRLWAPTAASVSVKLYRSGDLDAQDLLEVVPMSPAENGTWFAEKAGNLHGIYYTYLADVEGKIVEACDPYARTTGVNGHRAMVIDLASTNPTGWEDDTDPNPCGQITEAVIYELHIRDLSSNAASGIKHKGKFLGLTETGTRRSGEPTGLDHIKSMGITHLHLLPVYDFGSVDETGRSGKQYNWGYDPVNYNVPEGSYSTDPYHGDVRVREMKQMVKALHDNGISVVMDVVYNHVFHTEEFCFNVLVPGYFSRQTNGILSNGSGCGNDTASERAMVRKYIVDSIRYWADEYHIDGFRFDLVGLIDTRTINEVMAAVKADHPNVIFYGEGWNMNTQLTKPGYQMTIQTNSHLVPGFAFFSDTIRDQIRGSVFDNTTPGYVSGALVNRDSLEASFMGVPMWVREPDQCVNYVSCHDNNTLFDRIVLSTPKDSLEDQIKMNRLAAAFTILSQGVPFLQAGEELLRTKPARGGKFDGNSYKSPDSVNSIKWDTLKKEEYRITRDYYKGLIAFRKAHPGLRLSTRAEVWKQVHPIPCPNSHTLAFRVDEADGRIFLAFNADRQAVSLTLPEGKWHPCIQGSTAGTALLGDVGGSISVAPLSALVLVQKKADIPVDVVAALIWEKDKFLICQRPATKARGLLWEFVGGKVEPGESFPQALARECAEELAISVNVGEQFMQVIHEYPDILIRLTLFHCTIPTGYPQALEHNDIRWIHPHDIDRFTFCPADTDILAEIKKIYGNKNPL
ncbi:MAG: type I pullulanase [Oscillospiraceae bacterium]|nr:type I pullulanase [Oscillospiraceae bacterium]MBQ7129547.1 type I pullulanase [Oscillospiraceae bacterium]